MFLDCEHVSAWLVHCRRDISLVSNPPIGTSFGPGNVSQSLPVKGATTNVFLFGFTEILLSKSAPNLDALIPLNRAKSYDPNDPAFTFIPILEGEIRNLPVFLFTHFCWMTTSIQNTYYTSFERYFQGESNGVGYEAWDRVFSEKIGNYGIGPSWIKLNILPPS